MTPYYDDGSMTIYHGDNAEVLPHLPPVDMVFTSPPYNKGGTPWPGKGHWKAGQPAGGATKWKAGDHGPNGVGYTDHGDAMPWDEYAAWQQTVLSQLWAGLSEHGVIFYNHKPRVVGNRLWTPLELLPAEVLLRQLVVWDRGSGINFNPTAYLSTSEWLLVLARDEWRLRSRGASGVGDVWRVAPDVGNDHPAPFPVALPTRAIETTDAALILDPFMGSGSTLVAAKDLGRRAIGIDRSERYCEMAATRLAQGVLAV